MSESKAVFLDTEDNKKFTKTWGGLEFSIEKMPDRNIKVKVHEQETEICQEKTNEYGSYWIAGVYGGKGFVTFRPSKFDENKQFCILKLTEEVRLPANPNKPKGDKPKGGGKKPGGKKYGNAKAKPQADLPW